MLLLKLRVVLLVVLLLASAALSAQHPAVALAAAVDEPSPERRHAAAQQLAQREDVSLQQWQQLASALRLRPMDGAPLHNAAGAPADGHADDRTRRHTADLWVMNAVRHGEILVRVPADFAQRSGPLPLLLVGHRTGERAAQAIAEWSPLCDRLGWLLAAPTETYEAYRIEGWAYMPDARQGVIEALRAVRRRYDVDEDRIVLAGSARGGHMAWDVAARHPGVFAAIVAIDGSPRLGNVPFESNTKFLEGLAATAVFAACSPGLEATQRQNVQYAIDLLRQWGDRDVQLLATREFDDATLARLAAVRRRPASNLLRLPDRDFTPPELDWGRHGWIEVLAVDPGLFPKWPVPAKAVQWNRLDALGKRTFVDDYLREHTPRLQVTTTANGQFAVEDRGITSFRLLLTADQVAALGEDSQCVVTWRRKQRTVHVRPDKAVLLHEFVERLDRTFLPVAEVVVR